MKKINESILLSLSFKLCFADLDTIPYIVEEYGLKPNGQPIGTDPNLKDTDGDGLDDNEELHYFTNKLVYPLTLDQTRIMFSPASDPTKSDSDGDGALDGEDAYPNKYNDTMSYLFTDHEAEDFIINESIFRQIEIEDERGENVKNIPTFGIEDFKNEWNSMGLNAAGKKEYIIDEVYLIYHGAPQSISISNSGWLYADSSNLGYNSSTDIDINDLDKKDINYLNLSSCNNGNLDFNSNNLIAGYDDNIAISFLKSKHDIERITAWDGSASYIGVYFNIVGNEFVLSYESSSTSDSFDTWSIAVNGWKRKAEQQIEYYKDENQAIIINPNTKHKRFFQ